MIDKIIYCNNFFCWITCFQDHKVNILRINAHWVESDLNRSFHTKYKENFVHLFCSRDDEDYLRENYNIEFLKDGGNLTILNLFILLYGTILY